jgi:hypothetical protein
VYRRNEPGGLCRIAQGSAQLADGDAHHGIADGSLGPDSVEQRVFRHQAVGMGHQVVQHIEGFGGQGNGLGAAPEAGIVRVQTETAKEHWGENIHELLSS